MWDVELRDAELLGLARALDLRILLNSQEFEWRLQSQVTFGDYQTIRAMRAARSQHEGDGDAAKQTRDDLDYYEYLAARPAFCRVVLEGRLGYYDRLLPILARVAAAGPHARILDLGSFGGLASLYLGRRFPDATVVGVERLPGLVRIADGFRARLGLTNVSFQVADFNEYRPDAPFDLVVSLQTIPGYMLPWLPSETPDSYARGRNLAAEVEKPQSPVHEVVRALTSMRELTAGGGRAVLHERLQGVSRALLFHHLLARVGFQVVQSKMVDWHAVSQKGEQQYSPLTVATPSASPAPLDEAAVIDLYGLPAGFSDLSDLPADRSVTWQGLDAHANFHGLPGVRDELVVAAELKNGQRFQQHMGVLDGLLAYVYLCDTADRRNLSVCHTRHLRALFDTATDQLLASRGRGEVTRIDPAEDKLAYALTKRFRRYEP